MSLPRVALWLAAGVAGRRDRRARRRASSRGPHDTYTVRSLVSDSGAGAPVHDKSLVNAWGLAASSTGPWWTANEARGTSTLYSGTGVRQALTVRVDGGPTGIVFAGGRGFPVSGGGRHGPSRFVYASEDGMIRGWSPSVPSGWSTQAEIAVDRAGTAPSSGASRSRRCQTARAALRDRLPQRRASTSSTRRGGRCASRAHSPNGDPGVVRAVRHPGDRRPDLRHLRLPRPGERQRRADRAATSTSSTLGGTLVAARRPRWGR